MNLMTLLIKWDSNLKKLVNPKLCIFGSLNGPSISKFMEIIGKDNTTHRIIKNWKISDEKNNNN